MSHFSCFFFRKRRNKRNQTEREKRRKATAVSLVVLEKRLFRIKCSDRFSSLRRDCGDEPRPQIRQYRICSSPQVVAEVVCSLTAVRVAVNACGRRSFALYSPWVLRRLLVGGGRAMLAPTFYRSLISRREKIKSFVNGDHSFTTCRETTKNDGVQPSFFAF